MVASGVVDNSMKNEPIDLTTAYEGTQPIVEHHIERLVPVMVGGDLTMVPDEIIFIEGDDTVRYVNFSQMPPELQHVIRGYLDLVRGRALGNAVEAFKSAIDELKIAVQSVKIPQ